LILSLRFQSKKPYKSTPTKALKCIGRISGGIRVLFNISGLIQILLISVPEASRW